MQFINRIKLQLSSSFIWFVAVPLSPFRFVAVFVAVLTYTIFVTIDQWLSPFWPMVVAVLTNGCRHFDLCLVAVLTTIVAVLVCRRVALSPVWLSPFWICRRFGCRRFDLSPFWPVSVCRTECLFYPRSGSTARQQHGESQTINLCIKTANLENVSRN